MNELTAYQRFQLEKYGNILPEHSFSGYQPDRGEQQTEWIARQAELELIAHQN